MSLPIKRPQRSLFIARLMAVLIAAGLISTGLVTTTASAASLPLASLFTSGVSCSVNGQATGGVVISGVTTAPATDANLSDGYFVWLDRQPVSVTRIPGSAFGSQLTGLRVGDNTIRVSHLNDVNTGVEKTITAAACQPPTVLSATITGSLVTGLQGNGRAVLTLKSNYPANYETITATIDGDSSRSWTVDLPPSHYNPPTDELTIRDVGAGDHTLRLKGQTGSETTYVLKIPYIGGPTPTPTPTPSPTVTVSPSPTVTPTVPTPTPTTTTPPTPVFKPSVSPTTSCVSLVGSGLSQVFTVTYRNTGTAPGFIGRSVVLHGAATDPMPVNLAPGQTLVEHYPYPNTGEYGKGDVQMSFTAPGMSTVAFGESIDISKCKSADAWKTSTKYGKFCVRVATTAPNKVYWEDGYKSRGKWKFGRDRYLTKTGGAKTYCGNGPNVGNGRGKVSTNKIRVTVISGTTNPIGDFPQEVVKRVKVLTYTRR